MMFDKRTGRPLLDSKIVDGLYGVCSLAWAEIEASDDHDRFEDEQEALVYIKQLLRWYEKNPKRRNA